MWLKGRVKHSPYVPWGPQYPFTLLLRAEQSGGLITPKHGS